MRRQILDRPVINSQSSVQDNKPIKTLRFKPQEEEKKESPIQISADDEEPQEVSPEKMDEGSDNDIPAAIATIPIQQSLLPENREQLAAQLLRHMLPRLRSMILEELDRQYPIRGIARAPTQGRVQTGSNNPQDTTQGKCSLGSLTLSL